MEFKLFYNLMKNYIVYQKIFEVECIFLMIYVLKKMYFFGMVVYIMQFWVE